MRRQELPATGQVAGIPNNFTTRLNVALRRVNLGIREARLNPQRHHSVSFCDPHITTVRIFLFERVKRVKSARSKKRRQKKKQNARTAPTVRAVHTDASASSTAPHSVTETRAELLASCTRPPFESPHFCASASPSRPCFRIGGSF